MPQKTKKTDTQPRLIPVPVWIFFGVSLFLFCTAIYQSVLQQKLVGYEWETEVIIPTVIDTGDESIDWQWNTWEIWNPWNPSQWLDNQSDTQQSSIQVIEEALNGTQLIQQFYQVFSAKNVDAMLSLFDINLQRDSTIRQFFVDKNISSFIDNIENNRLSPANIQLLPPSKTGTEEYQYDLIYRLASGKGIDEMWTVNDFIETWIIKVKTTQNWPKISSIRCETHRCSFNPFFRPENYGIK